MIPATNNERGDGQMSTTDTGAARIALGEESRRQLGGVLQNPDAFGIAPARALQMVSELAGWPREPRTPAPGAREIVLTGAFRFEMRRALQTGDREQIRRCLREIENAYELRTSAAMGARELAVTTNEEPKR